MIRLKHALIGRYTQHGKIEEYRSRGRCRFAAETTNRFDTGMMNKGSPIRTCKCLESNSKMYNDKKVLRADANTRCINVKSNPDIHVKSTDRDHMKSKVPMVVEVARCNEGDRISSTCGMLYIEATVEEDNDYKDIRVRISDISGLSQFYGNKDKIAVAECCAPIVCTDTNIEGLLTSETQLEPTVDETCNTSRIYPLTPQLDEMFESKETENLSKRTLNVDRTIREENFDQQYSLSKKFNNTVENHSFNEYHNKTFVDRGTFTMNGTLKPTNETKEVASSIDNETSGYNTSESPNCLIPNHDFVRTEQGINRLDDKSKRSQNITSSAESEHESAAMNDTLEVLRRLLKNTDKTEFETRQNEFQQSKGSLKGMSRSMESDHVRANQSVPIRVDYSEATLTAEDLTRPEFVSILTDLEEQSRNLDKQLFRMNRALKSKKYDNVAVLNETVDGSRSLVKQDTADENCSIQCLATCNITTVATTVEEHDGLASLTSQDGISSKGRKKQKKKKADAVSQSNSFEFDQIIASTPKKLKKPRVNPVDSQDSKVDTKYSGLQQTMETEKSEPTFLEIDGDRVVQHLEIGTSMRRLSNESRDHFLVSKNQSFIRKSKDNVNVAAPSPRLTTTTDDSVMSKSSKVHRLEKPAIEPVNKKLDGGYSIKFVDEEEEPTFVGQSENGFKIISSSLQSPTRSMIPTRKISFSRKPESISVQSTDTRMETTISTEDLSPSVPPTTLINNDDESGSQRGRRRSRYLLPRLASLSPFKNRKNGATNSSVTSNTNRRSSNIASRPPGSVHNTSNPLDVDTLDETGRSRNHGRTEMIAFERTQTTPKSITFRQRSRGAPNRDDSRSVNKNPPVELKSSGASGSFLEEERLGSNSKNQQRSRNRTGKSNRVNDKNTKGVNISSRPQKLENTIGKFFKRHIQGIHYGDDKSLIDSRRRSLSRSSRIPTIRLPELNPEEDSSSTDYMSVNRTARRRDDISNLVFNNDDKKSKTQQRSNSDPREADNFMRRDSR